jgi:hypothetical protein
MSAAFAPAHLPAAPRPFPDELLSSWLLRLAAANAISLEELLSGLQWRYPHSQHFGHPLDYAVPPETLQALSLFARGRTPIFAAWTSAFDLVSSTRTCSCGFNVLR